MNRQLNLVFIGLTLAIVIGLAGCHKNDTVAPTPTGTLYFHLHTNIDTAEVDDYGTVYTDSLGRRLYLSLAQLYVSGIKALKADGSSVSLDSAIILKTKDIEQYRVQQIPVGNYTSVSFQVGLNATNNQATPSSYPATSALSAQSSSMWFGSTSQGYMFVNVQGGIDTTKAQTADVSTFQPFSYQLGTANELTTVTLPAKNFTITAGQGQEVHITIDYAKLLNGLNLKTENTATPFTNATVAAKAAKNIPSLFRYEQ